MRDSKVVVERAVLPGNDDTCISATDMRHCIHYGTSHGEQVKRAERRTSTSRKSNDAFDRRPKLHESGLCDSHGDELRKGLEAALAIRPENCEADSARAAKSQMDCWGITYSVFTDHWPDVL